MWSTGLWNGFSRKNGNMLGKNCSWYLNLLLCQQPNWMLFTRNLLFARLDDVIDIVWFCPWGKRCLVSMIRLLLFLTFFSRVLSETQNENVEWKDMNNRGERPKSTAVWKRRLSCWIYSSSEMVQLHELRLFHEYRHILCNMLCKRNENNKSFSVQSTKKIQFTSLELRIIVVPNKYHTRGAPRDWKKVLIQNPWDDRNQLADGKEKARVRARNAWGQSHWCLSVQLYRWA